MIMNEYRNLPFCTISTCGDFYSYFSLEDLVSKAAEDKEMILRCQTVGVLQSDHGRFYLSDLDCPAGPMLVQISVAYLKTPIPSTVRPYPVQVFGTLQWKNRPVIFAKSLQALTVANAIRVRNAMKSIAERHQVDPTKANISQT